MTFKILAQVSGGMTGMRQGFVKRDGEIQTWESRDAAQAEADRLNREMNRPPRNGATFRYTVVED